VSAKEGEFRTIIPAAYVQSESSVQYWARGPEENGFVTSLLVAREAVRKGDTKTFAPSYGARREALRSPDLAPISLERGCCAGVRRDYLTTGGGTVQGKKCTSAKSWSNTAIGSS
jgi:hypothetical protein